MKTKFFESRGSCKTHRGMGVSPMKHGQDARATFNNPGFCKSLSIKLPSIASALSLILCFVPSTPARAESYGTGHDVYVTAGALAIHDGDLLLLTWPAGAGKANRALLAVDISDPSAPQLRDRLVIDGFPQGLALDAGQAYVVNGRDLLVVDLANPAALSLRARLRLAEDPLNGPQGISIRDGLAWLACRRGGVQAVDVSDPANPRLVGAAAVDGFVREVAVANGLLYAAADTRGVYLFDIKNPASPVKISRIPLPRGSAGRFSIREAVAYFAGGNLLVANLSLENAREPAWIGATADRHVLSPYFGSYACDLDVGLVECRDTGDRFTLAVVADAEGGLIVSDVSRPEAPAFLGGLKGGEGPDIATGVVLRGNLAYVTDESYGLRVVDVSNPRAPQPVGKGLDLRE